MKVIELFTADIQDYALFRGHIDAIVGNQPDHQVETHLITGTEIAGQDIAFLTMFVKRELALQYYLEF